MSPFPARKDGREQAPGAVAVRALRPRTGARGEGARGPGTGPSPAESRLPGRPDGGASRGPRAGPAGRGTRPGARAPAPGPEPRAPPTAALGPGPRPQGLSLRGAERACGVPGPRPRAGRLDGAGPSRCSGPARGAGPRPAGSSGPREAPRARPREAPAAPSRPEGNRRGPARDRSGEGGEDRVGGGADALALGLTRDGARARPGNPWQARGKGPRRGGLPVQEPGAAPAAVPPAPPGASLGRAEGGAPAGTLSGAARRPLPQATRSGPD